MSRHRIHLGKSYHELILLPTYEERYEYLRIGGVVGEATFGGDRYLNQVLYTSKEWRSFRDAVIIRDNGCDMAMDGYDILDMIIIHHINPLDPDDVIKRSPCIFDMDNVVCVSPKTHRAIHYGNKSLLPQDPIERRPGDHCEWLTGSPVQNIVKGEQPYDGYTGRKHLKYY